MMATSEEGHVATKDSVVLSLCAGSSLAKGQIIFSFDSKFLFCCSGSVVKVFNTANGQCAQELRGHRSAVTGLAINPVNKLQLFSCGIDGLVNRWDYSDGVLLKTDEFFMPLYGFVSVDTSASYINAIARRPQASSCCVVRLHLRKSPKNKSGKSENSQPVSPAASVKSDVLLPVTSSDHRAVSTGCNGDVIACVHGHELSIYSCKKKTLKKLTAEKSNPFTCLACHPTEHCIATGHANGKITLWWNFLSKEKTVMSSNHWHSLPVQTLAFTPEGSYLLSGGHECVLVKWQMNSEGKDFLPRLGSPIHSVTPSPDGTLYLTSHTDNVLQVLTSNFQISHAIRGLARAHLGADKKRDTQSSPVGLLCEPRSKALVTNGRPGHLQFYCMSTDTQLFNLDIVGQNYISPDNLKKPAAVTEVEQAAFDLRGDWLATFEHWDDSSMTPEYRIKFWLYNKRQQNYQLNTTIESPHNKAVGCLRFRPSTSADAPPTMVSTAPDGFFKLWTLVTETHINKKVKQWTCDTVGYYRDRPAGMARFSEDGSVLAVAFQKTLTLWEPDDNVMKATLALPTCNEHIKFVEFGGKTCSHFVVTTTQSHLTVWNLISLSVHLRISLDVTALATDGDLMSVVTSNQSLYVFRPNKWQPVFQKEKAWENPIVGAIFLSETGGSRQNRSGTLDWQNQSRLYLLDDRQQLVTPHYLSDVTSANKESSRSGVELRQTLPQTPFSTLLSASRQREGASATSSQLTGKTWHRGGSASAVLDVMNTAAPTMEPFHLICGQFMESLLLRNKGDAENMDQEEESDADDSSEDSMATDSS